MKKLLFLCISLAVSIGLAPATGATANSSLELEIFPLGCSVDTTATGPSTSQQITPEECRPFSKRIKRSPVPAPPAATGEVVSPTLDAAPSPILSVPATYYNTSGITISDSQDVPTNTENVQVLDTQNAAEGTTRKVKEEQERALHIELPPVLAAVLITAIFTIPTGAIAPILSRLGSLRFPWNK